MSEKVVVSWNICHSKYWKCVENFQKNLSKEFGANIDIGDEEWSDLFDELVNGYIKFDDNDE